MTGTVRKNGKNWGYVFDGPRRPSGRRRQVTRSGFRTKKVAEAELRRAIVAAEHEAAERALSPGPVISDWLANTWLLSRRNLKHSTFVSYEGIIRNHVGPDPIGAMRLPDVTAQELDEFFLRLAFKPGKKTGETLSGKTRKNVYRVLKGAFDFAVTRNLISENPLNSVEEPRPGKPEILVWASEDVQRFLTSARQESARMEPLYTLALATGLRRGELAGLQWRHINFETKKLRVEQARVYAGGVVYVEEPKTQSSVRTIGLGPEALAALRRMQAIQHGDAAALGDVWTDSKFVFTKPNGDALHPDYLTRRFKRDTKIAGVRYIKLHGLRHTFATNALARGANPKAVSEILGHGHVQTTLALYSQHLPGVHASIIEAVQNDLFGRVSDPDVINAVTNPSYADREQGATIEETPATARVSGGEGCGL